MIRTFLGALTGALLSTSALAQEDPLDLAPPANSEAPTLPALVQVDPDLTPMTCPFAGQVEYERGAIECGRITVPENREDPETRMIHLHYVRIAATGEDSERREDPIIYLTGGPGVVVQGYADRLKDHPVAEYRDLYILEQRGIANSTDFCEHYSLTNPGQSFASVEDMERMGADRMASCFEEATAQGVDLRGYSTLENARDVAALRSALGFEQWNVWGISYGSHLGQMLLNVDPDGIRALVIDAIVPNDVHGLGEYSRVFPQVIDNFTDSCEGPSFCDGLKDRFYAAIQSLQDDPLVLPVDNPSLSESGEIWIPPAGLAYLPFMMAYEQSEHPVIPATMHGMIELVENRDPFVIEALTTVLNADGLDGGAISGISVSQGMSDAIRCNDGYVHEGLAYVDVESEWSDLIFSAEGTRYRAATCERFGLAPRDRSDYVIPQASRPTLIVNGAWDPVTPPWLAEYIHEQMPGSRYVEVPYAGHGPTRSMPECASVLTDFFDTPDVQALDVSCLEAGVDAPEYLTLLQSDAIFHGMMLTGNAPQSFVLPMIWIGAPLGILVLSLILLPLGFLARLIDGSPSGELKADTDGARLILWLGSVLGVVGAGLFASGVQAGMDISAMSILGGFGAPAGLGAWLILVTGALGIVGLYTLFRANISHRLRIGTLLGLSLTGVSAIALATFAIRFDLLPF